MVRKKIIVDKSNAERGKEKDKRERNWKPPKLSNSTIYLHLEGKRGEKKTGEN